ncbi:glycerol-3-phosphate 1-O-acyltransferase PlsB [Halomonas sp. MCCC 1A17488]|uniref:glycerol-3-phosphate 1-O-acyltransferase PlsB n=1 Tax=unclassified Halomonas TaxID=2609666 RepID=UPI0018D26AB9|nr:MULTISPECIES: glycerol-3-phosphate 1-O-acyltransferase PlsB [unclassified Halomonas]MCE8016409.1 glycerol-3-phosphate 1-O-acyltransferase PlsB [Halomonas sp. MCCC 1A17488]MCG3239742.1 glycerol-3-phosphate 1-O-acyltransferase PlsB [Halomonas sp. MCCC 1A17488]QPP50353.1 glycerol-3-phosphate 1-O-acyltransferase PlsB [Halomonas sp. SS10-MC5]
MALAQTLLAALHAPWKGLIKAWVETRLIEPDPGDLHLDPAHPTLYVLPHPALSDALLLDVLCQRHGLPPARGRIRLEDRELPASVALPARQRRLWQHRRALEAPFRQALEYLAEHPEADIQLVPVSVFWGRAPGKRFGFWHLLAADSWQLTGRLRRALSVLVNGKSVEVHFGAPLKLRDLLDARGPAVANRKSARLLRVHFRRMRTRVLGPDLSHRRTLIEGVAASPEVRRVIGELAPAEKRSPQRLQRRALRYGREIASNMTYPVLRFMDGLLRRLWNRLYDGVEVRGLERVKALAGDHTLVYVPCHRSHIDYLLLSYVLYRDGLMPPHIAAGRNLNMPLIGPLLRRGGAFFLRRSFRDKPLYAAVFNEYLHRLLERGHPLEYFIEGGRSRSGRMLAPRPGMLSMTLRSFCRSAAGTSPPRLAFVPVYVGYERIIENASYQRELRGGKKRKETPLALLRVLGQLRQPFGKVTVNVGEPLALGPWLDDTTPGWRDDLGPAKPAWLNQAVPRLGDELARRINAAAALNPVNLVALVLLATPHHAIEASLMARQLALLAALQRHGPGGQHVSLPRGEPDAWIDEVVALGMIERRPHALGDILTATAEQASLLVWYRNNVLHLFALPGLAAFAFRHAPRHDLDSLQAQLGPPWPILARELFLEPAALPQALPAMLEVLCQEGLLQPHADGWQRPGTLEAGEQLRLLARLMQPSLERGYLLLTILLSQPAGTLGREALAERSQQLTERLALLTGRDAPEFFDRKLFASLIDSLEAEGWIWEREERLWYDERLRSAAQRTGELYDPALRHRLQLISHG